MKRKTKDYVSWCRDPECKTCFEDDIPTVLNIECDGQRRQISPSESEIQRLTLENSELRGTISCMQAHRLLSKGG